MKIEVTMKLLPSLFGENEELLLTADASVSIKVIFLVVAYLS
jgi:hypothetical protein